MSIIKLNKYTAGNDDETSIVAFQSLLLAIKRQVVAAGVEHGLTNMQSVTLVYVIPKKGCAMSELSNILGCDASNVTGLVDGLEGKGLISRQEKPGDRRVKILQLEAAGEAARADILKKAATFVDQELLNSLTNAESRQFKDLTAKIMLHSNLSRQSKL